MADLTAVTEASGQENLLLHRAAAILGGILAGAGLAWRLGRGLLQYAPDPGGAVGPQSLGWIPTQQGLLAVLVTAAATLAVVAALWLWLQLAFWQTKLSALPAATALKRAALPFAVFLPQIPALLHGRPYLSEPFLAFLALCLGLFLLALMERGDKRKIFFAHPTGAEYHPAALFTHGAVVTLGAGCGWFLQSLPGGAERVPGIWFVIFAGAAVWVLSLILAWLLKFLFNKLTYDQVYLAVALSLLPLALLPLQSLGGVQFLQAGQAVGGFRLEFLPYTLAALAAFGCLTILVLTLLQLRRRPLEMQPAWEELFRAVMLISAIPLLLLAAAFWPGGGPLGANAMAGPLDLFREGESLASAQAVLLGRMPFKEILFRHGFFSDALAGLAAIQWFGASAASYRFLLSWLLPVGLVGLYFLAIFCLPWLWALLVALTLLTGTLGTVAEARFFFAYISFLFTLLYLQRGRWYILIFSGLLTALAVMSSFTAGVLALVGNLVLLLTWAAFGSADLKGRLLGPGVYAGAALVGLIPWWLYLALSGSLSDYFANFAWVITQYHTLFGLPLPGWGPQAGLGAVVVFLVPPAALLLGALFLLDAMGRVRERGLPWNMLLLVTVAALLWFRYLERGEAAFLKNALPLAAMVLAFFLFRLCTHNNRLRSMVFLGLALATLVPRPGAVDLVRLAGSFGAKNQIRVDGLAMSPLPTLNRLYLPPQQAGQLTELSEYLDSQVGTAESFFDFSNQPLLYFLVPRRPVVKSLATVTLSSFQQQREAIRDLQAARPKVVLWPGTGVAGFDGIPSEVRHYAVAEYLLKDFDPVAVKGNVVILAPREETAGREDAAAQAMIRPLALDRLPGLWGRLKKYDPSQGGAAGTVEAPGGVQAVMAAGLTVTANGEKISVAAGPGPVSVKLLAKPSSPAGANVLVLALAADAALSGREATLDWGQGPNRQEISFRLLAGGEQAYVFRVDAVPGWVYAPKPVSLRLTLPAGGFSWAGGRLLAVRDVPELSPAAPKTAPAEKKGAATGKH